MPKISALPVETQVNTADIFVIDQTGTTKQATGSLVAAMVGSNIVVPITQVTGLTAALAAKLAVASNLSDVASAATSRTNLGLGPLTNGQLAIGSTGVAPVLTTLTAGAGISIGNTAGAITITASGSGAFSWTNVTGTSQGMSVNNGYLANNGGLVTLTLPLLANIGDEVDIIGVGAGGWLIAQNASQLIRIGSSSSVAGVGGSVASTNRRDTVTLVCSVANLEWTAYSVIGNLTIV